MTLIVVQQFLRTLQPQHIHFMLGLAAIGPEHQTLEVFGILLPLDDDAVVGLVFDDGGDFGDGGFPSADWRFPVVGRGGGAIGGSFGFATWTAFFGGSGRVFVEGAGAALAFAFCGRGGGFLCGRFAGGLGSAADLDVVCSEGLQSTRP